MKLKSERTAGLLRRQALGDAVDIVIVVRVSAVDERQDYNREPRPRWLAASRQDWRLAFRELSVCRRARDRRRLGCLRRVSPALPQPMRQTVARGGEVAAIGPEGERQPVRHRLLIRRRLEICQFDDAAQLLVAGLPKSVSTVSVSRVRVIGADICCSRMMCELRLRPNISSIRV